MNKLFFMCGIPGGGKSTWAEANKDKLCAVVHSSDAIREEFCDDVNDQSKNELVFTTLHKRIKEDLLNGKNVIYDSTGLKRKNRLHFLREIKNIPCKKVCVLFATPIDICKQNNANRERKVPESVIDRMLKNFECPCVQEGWNDIKIVYWDWNKDGLKFDYEKDLERWTSVPHDNPHHVNSIGNHMIKAYDYMLKNTDDPILLLSAKMHDCGKNHTKKFIDSKGNPSKTAHFYNHNNVGSYLSLFYLKDSYKDSYDLTDDDVLNISLLIEMHMKPFLSWDKSEKAEKKDRTLFGDDTVDSVMVLHQCDLAAH